MRISILALGRKKKGKRISRSNVGRRQKKKRIPNQRLEESKKERKIPDQRSEENKRKYTERYLDQTISEQYKIVTRKQEKKGNHNWKWSSPFDHQPKSCALVTFPPRTKQKQRRKRPKHLEPNSSPKHRSRKSPIDP